MKKNLIVFLSGIIFLVNYEAFAAKLCIKKTQAVKNKSVVLQRAIRAATTCPRGYIEVLDTASFQGPAGSNGLDGANGTNGTNGSNGSDGQDGMDAAWGDGSAGAKVISANETFDDDNVQFTDFTVNSGVTVTVPSGTIIRCTGTATINGTINVDPAGSSGQPNSLGSNKPASQGLSSQSSGDGEVGSNGANRQGGYAATALDSTIGRSIIRPSVFSGGAGGGGLSGTSTTGEGGGGFAIYCKDGINISGTGTIAADGGYGGNCQGGGAGGVIVLASLGTVTHTGIVRASGATGGFTSIFCANGGGGGGGLIHILAQTITGNNANLVVTGGSGISAQAAGTVTQATRSGGGAGGQGGIAYTDGSTSVSQAGSAGLVIKRSGFNPAGMLN
jgi:hypothetical protein